MNDNSDFAHLKYRIRVLVRHPTLDPAEITSSIGIEPDRQQKVGEKFKAPNGTYPGAINRISWWSKSYDFSGDRSFFSNCEVILAQLETKRSYILDLRKSGGEVSIIFDLAGESNIGSNLSWVQMERFARMQIDLGLEVFPDW